MAELSYRDAVAYGIACMELEAGDSALRSFCSVQGSLAMFSIWMMAVLSDSITPTSSCRTVFCDLLVPRSGQLFRVITAS